VKKRRHQIIELSEIAISALQIAKDICDLLCYSCNQFFEAFDGNGFVNLEYPSSLGGSFTVRSSAPAPATFLDETTHTRYCVDAVTCTPGSWTPSAVPVRDATGLPFQTPTVLDGVVYNSGSFTVGGSAVFFGSVVAQKGVLDGAGNPGFYFDESLLLRTWPRAGRDIPRVIISSWQTDP